ncbi:MAG: hypothetical protein FGM58_07675 [Acidimicrobiia bacterium]|nr:hypothetical protein [Acidimicrobiia bacterium]
MVSGRSADAASDARARRAEVRAEQARLAAQVDVMEGTQAEVLAALGVLDQDVRTQQAIVADLRQQADASTAEAARAEQESEVTSREIGRLRNRIARIAVESYVSPPGEDLLQRFRAASAQEDATRQALLTIQSRADVDLVDRLRAAKGRLAEQIARAQQARAEAERALAESTVALERLEAARARQRTLASQVRSRLDERLADAAHLSRLDAAFGAQIAAEEAALARAVAPIPPPAPGTSTPPTVTRPALTTVGGITVATSIADDTRALLAAAAAAGHRLGGYGYRDINVQIQLRRQNCGTSNYAIWEMPADACSPPTARPGYSAHERGLAIDFTANGAFINSRRDPAFVWLSANAGRFGFTNLPSEPWHWSHPG